jgi:hypothetical protein
MKFQGAFIKEQGITFAVVVVKKNVIDDRNEANNTITSFKTIFPATPIVLMAQDFSGRPTYFGRPDIVRFLANVPLQAIPWREYTIE